ncbi:MAG: hypothetical protein GXY55_17595 [Phycisphaerae bacterium]|nr:hypothetical protein [Phycisphaerae bacterium]
MQEHFKQTASSALLAGIIMLVVVLWLRAGLQGTSDSALYNASVTAFNATLWGGGLAMFGVAGACWAQWRPAFRLDSICSGLVGVIMIGVGLIWLAATLRDLDGYAVLIFGVLCLHSAYRSYRIDAALRATEQQNTPQP